MHTTKVKTMIKYLSILRKKPSWTEEEFRHHWKNVHGALIAQLPGLMKYTQYHVQSAVLPGVEQVDEPIEGIAELWFESEEALKQAMESPVGQRVTQDAAELLERTNHYDHLLIVKETLEVR
jgi:uncharacterized protein (TIGR02118 family)